MNQLAFVGVGHIHTPGFINMLKKRSDVRVKSVWDHQHIRAEVRAKELSANIINDLDQIWYDKEIAGVVICSETNRHEELVAAAARAKKHMFVEKPLGVSARDGQKMADEIEKAGVIFQTGYFMRSDPKIRYIRKLITDGAMGKITRIRGSNCHSGSLGGWFDSKPGEPAADWRWMADPAQSGVGAYGDLGTHLLDIMIWLMGDVSGCSAQIDNATARYPGCDETGEGLMRFKNGAIGTLAAGWVDVANPISLLVSGTEAHAAIINNQLHVTSKKSPSLDGTAPMRTAEVGTGLGHAFELYLDAVCGIKGVELVSAREAAYRSTVMEALYESSASGRWVEVG